VPSKLIKVTELKNEGFTYDDDLKPESVQILSTSPIASTDEQELHMDQNCTCRYILHSLTLATGPLVRSIDRASGYDANIVEF
jgi:hypothetical protein